MSDQLRLLWWNVDWQHAGETERQLDQVLALEPTVVALCELSAQTSARWRSALEGAGYTVLDDPDGSGRASCAF